MTLVSSGFRRIISLSPSVTENLFAIGAGDRVVGVTTVCDFPETARNLPRVGDFRRPSWERILASRPDAVIVESATIQDADIARIRERVGCRVEVLRPRTVDDVLANLNRLGAWCARSRETSAIVRRLNARVSAVRRRAAGRPRRRVFVEVSETPLYAAGPGSFVDDLIRLAGGVNAVGGREPFPMVSKEMLLSANVDVYVVAAKAGGDAVSRPLARGARVLV
ncbi:MAG: helical backbone metal receptor, partial [Armatimonadaceae bacterium]